MPGWTLQMGASGGALRNYASLADLNFLKRLNGLGMWSALIPSLQGLAAPSREEVCRIVWDLGGPNQRVFFEGICTDARRDGKTNAYIVKGLGVEGLLWRSRTGGIRTWKRPGGAADTTVAPLEIIQGAVAGQPNNLLTNMQGTNVMAYGAAAVPNILNAASPGVATDFRADSQNLLVNIQRLCLQAQYGTRTVPNATTPYGLEFLARLEGANNSTPTFYLVRRREQSPAPAEILEVDVDFLRARRGQEGLSAAQALRVIGQGDGTSRVESGIIGAGGIEGLIADKTLIATANNAAGNGNAAVMANRLSQLLDPTVEVVTGLTPRHATLLSDLGDSVTIRQTGQADASLRLVQLEYRLSWRMFALVLGRPRAFDQDPWFRLSGLLGGEATSPQMTDTKPKSLQDVIQAGGTFAKTRRANGSNVTLGAMSAATTILDSSVQGISAGALASLGKGEGLLWQVLLRITGVGAGSPNTGASHQHTYDKSNTPTNAPGGLPGGASLLGATDTVASGSGQSPGLNPTAGVGGQAADDATHTHLISRDWLMTHTHVLTFTSTLTGAAGTGTGLLAGPIQIEVDLVMDDGSTVILGQFVLPHLRVDKTYFILGTYDLAAEGSTDNFTPSRIVLAARNDGDFSITFGALAAEPDVTEVGVWTDPLHRHNEP